MLRAPGLLIVEMCYRSEAIEFYPVYSIGVKDERVIFVVYCLGM